MRTHGQVAEMAKNDSAVLGAVGPEPRSIRDIRKHTKERTNISQATIFSSLARLAKAGKVVRVEVERGSQNGRPKTAYRGKGPQPTVFWRRV